MSSHPRLLVPPEEGATLKAAARRFKLSVDTIRRLYRAHGIGRQSSPRAPIIVSLPALMMIQHADVEALMLLREGRRDHPAVQRYLQIIGAHIT
ncbi:hypothetical protein [Antarcticirhabdus aurantiaca]|uniref:Uncharacterized protein n=1 Tax=Antarcticirhabdus aurantiaca TaxID=2606717 RepID=A0ACD4NKG9_9HYPH|nr:hypothetical protein [Antarcticirhabdus aurantiaca]WAJ27378.1 hypothetical protein OXU80_21405 [Jeongeuplla avenae]